MKMDKNNNVYIIVYSVVMVVVVAAVLAVAAMVLQPIQNKNIALETKGALLASVGVETDSRNVEAEYAKYITEIAVPTPDGEDSDKSSLHRVLFKSTAGGRTLYIIPVSGSGLWGPVWGYVALEEDWNTISGVVFDHKGETPGLGAEISTPKFEGQFTGKRIFDDAGALVSITVLKGAGASRGNDHAVDAISGGTITSRAVETMIRATLQQYLPYIEQQKGTQTIESAEAATGIVDAATESTVTTEPTPVADMEHINTETENESVQ
jgi:Na+-transporting NADH:ubiquinone oxidoreductase subunit C